MTVHETILTRRTVHDYVAKPIPDGLLERALTAAIHAPNHKLTNPWRFVRMGPQTRSSITELAIELKCKGRTPTSEKRAKMEAKFGNPAELLAVSQVLTDDAFRRREDYAAVACAIENFMLAAWAEGVGTKWSSGDITSDPQTYQLLGIDADIEEIVGFLWVGYPEHPNPMPRRAPLEQVFREVP